MKELEHLVKLMARLPGLGPRSARRVAHAFIKRPERLLEPLQQALHDLKEAITLCQICGNIDNHNPCHICKNEARDSSLLCVVEEVGDLWAIERAGGYKGKYHVLGGCLSALDGVGPEALNIRNLEHRLGDESSPIEEIIIATNLTMDGQTTAHYIHEVLESYNMKITRLAHGVPIGGELDYLDDGTLRAAFNARKIIS